MPGCCLRVIGRRFDVHGYLEESPFEPCAVWIRGERRSPRSPQTEHSGFNLVVSDAPDRDLPGQIGDAIQFMQDNIEELRRLSAMPEIDDMTLDFGIAHRPVIVQSDHLPAPLIRLAGSLGLGIELTQYPVALPDSESQ